jgi:hypothetical protein
MEAESWLVISTGASGILRREPTRGACIRWACGVVGGGILERDQLDECLVVFVIGWGGREDRMAVIVCTELAAAREGYSIDQQPLYPYAEQPYVEVAR